MGVMLVIKYLWKILVNDSMNSFIMVDWWRSIEHITVVFILVDGSLQEILLCCLQCLQVWFHDFSFDYGWFCLVLCFLICFFLARCHRWQWWFQSKTYQKQRGNDRKPMMRLTGCLDLQIFQTGLLRQDTQAPEPRNHDWCQGVGKTVVAFRNMGLLSGN